MRWELWELWENCFQKAGILFGGHEVVSHCGRSGFGWFGFCKILFIPSWPQTSSSPASAPECLDYEQMLPQQAPVYSLPVLLGVFAPLIARLGLPSLACDCACSIISSPSPQSS